MRPPLKKTHSLFITHKQCKTMTNDHKGGVYGLESMLTSKHYTRIHGKLGFGLILTILRGFLAGKPLL